MDGERKTEQVRITIPRKAGAGNHNRENSLKGRGDAARINVLQLTVLIQNKSQSPARRGQATIIERIASRAGVTQHESTCFNSLNSEPMLLSGGGAWMSWTHKARDKTARQEGRERKEGRKERM